MRTKSFSYATGAYEQNGTVYLFGKVRPLVPSPTQSLTCLDLLTHGVGP